MLSVYGSIRVGGLNEIAAGASCREICSGPADAFTPPWGLILLLFAAGCLLLFLFSLYRALAGGIPYGEWRTRERERRNARFYRKMKKTPLRPGREHEGHTGRLNQAVFPAVDG